MGYWDHKRIIKHIAAIEPGWTYRYLWYGGGEFHITTAPMTGQAVVETHYPPEMNEGDGVETRTEFLVVDTGYMHEPVLLSELEDEITNGMNTIGIAIFEPGQSCELKDVEAEMKSLQKKLQASGYWEQLQAA